LVRKVGRILDVFFEIFAMKFERLLGSAAVCSQIQYKVCWPTVAFNRSIRAITINRRPIFTIKLKLPHYCSSIGHTARSIKHEVGPLEERASTHKDSLQAGHVPKPANVEAILVDGWGSR
jgi:hypothetical protein